MENNNYLVPTNISIENLPHIITSAISDISNVDKKIKNAVSKADEAKQSAEGALQKEAGWSLFGGDKKEAIEALQIAAVNQANALTDTVDANKELFENQKKMPQAIRYLFGLGVRNIAANRTVVRELELKLKNASEEELSELARQELTNVILQLRAQEDTQNRIEGHDKLFQEHKSCLDSMDNSISAFKDECIGKLKEIEIVKKKIEDKSAQIDEDFQKLEKDLTSQIISLSKSLLDDISALARSLENSVAEKVAKATAVMEPRISELEDFKRKEIESKTFFDSTFYKMVVGLIAIVALLCSIFL